MTGPELPRAWVVRIELDQAPEMAAPRHVHAEEIVFSLALLPFLLWVTLSWLA